jgi:hypothetical protein
MNEPLDTADSTFPVITLAPSYIAPVKGPDPREAKFGNLFGGDKDQRSTVTTNSDSFNSTVANTTSNSVGDSSIAIGAPGGGANDTVALVVGGIALLGAIYLFTRK